MYLLLASDPLARDLKSQKFFPEATLRLQLILGKPVHFHFIVLLALASVFASKY